MIRLIWPSPDDYDREMDLGLLWAFRARLAFLVLAIPAFVLILIGGPGSLLAGIAVGLLLPAALIAFVMIGLAFWHFWRAARAARRGSGLFHNGYARWVAGHGFGLAMVIVAAVIVSAILDRLIIGMAFVILVFITLVAVAMIARRQTPR